MDTGIDSASFAASTDCDYSKLANWLTHGRRILEGFIAMDAPAASMGQPCWRRWQIMDQIMKGLAYAALHLH